MDRDRITGHQSEDHHLALLSRAEQNQSTVAYFYSGAHYFNVNDYSAPLPFTYDNSPRMFSDLRSPAYFDTDLSGIKVVPIRGSLRAEIRAEAFNLFNRPIFGPPDTTLVDGSTATVGNQVNLPRQLQLAVKLLW